MTGERSDPRPAWSRARLLDSPTALLQDRAVLIAEAPMMLGPLVTAKLSTLADFEYGECVRAAVDGFLHVYGKPHPEGAPSDGAQSEDASASGGSEAT